MDAILEPGTEPVGYRETGLARYLREVGRSRLLNRSEEKRLLELARRGDRRALNDLVTANLKWVVAVSAEYTDRGLPMPDLIAEGNLGLIRAAVSFDPNHAQRFTAYAIWWIRRALERALSRLSRDWEAGEGKGTVPAVPGAASRGAAPIPLLTGEVRHALEGVREPGRTVIKLFFGIDSRRPLGLEQIAQLLGIPPRRARLLKDLALRRLQGSLPDPRRG